MVRVLFFDGHVSFVSHANCSSVDSAYEVSGGSLVLKELLVRGAPCRRDGLVPESALTLRRMLERNPRALRLVFEGPLLTLSDSQGDAVTLGRRY